MGLKRERNLLLFSTLCAPGSANWFGPSLSAIVGLRAWYAFFRGVARIIAQPTLIGGLGAAVMVLAWAYRPMIEALVGYPVPRDARCALGDSHCGYTSIHL